MPSLLDCLSYSFQTSWCGILARLGLWGSGLIPGHLCHSHCWPSHLFPSEPKFLADRVHAWFSSGLPNEPIRCPTQEIFLNKWVNLWKYTMCTYRTSSFLHMKKTRIGGVEFFFKLSSDKISKRIGYESKRGESQRNQYITTSDLVVNFWVCRLSKAIHFTGSFAPVLLCTL